MRTHIWLRSFQRILKIWLMKLYIYVMTALTYSNINAQLYTLHKFRGSAIHVELSVSGTSWRWTMKWSSTWIILLKCSVFMCVCACGCTHFLYLHLYLSVSTAQTRVGLSEKTSSSTQQITNWLGISQWICNVEATFKPFISPIAILLSRNCKLYMNYLAMYASSINVFRKFILFFFPVILSYT